MGGAGTISFYLFKFYVLETDKWLTNNSVIQCIHYGLLYCYFIPISITSDFIKETFLKFAFSLQVHTVSVLTYDLCRLSPISKTPNPCSLRYQS